MSELKIQYKEDETAVIIEDGKLRGIMTSFSFTVKRIGDQAYRFKMHIVGGMLIAEFDIRYYSSKEQDQIRQKKQAISQLFSIIGVQSSWIEKSLDSTPDYEVLKENYYHNYNKASATLLISAYYYIACFFAYYRPKVILKDPVEPRSRRTKTQKEAVPEKKRSKEKDRVIIFHEYVTMMNRGKITHKQHNPFTHAFKVRPHPRHYKNGLTIWIEEYTKGAGEVKDKTYKIKRSKKHD